MFIHRSVGQNLIDDGDLRPLLISTAKKAGLEIKFSDINNNEDKSIPGNDTKPENYADYFSTHYLSEDLVIIKSCYPNSNIGSDGDLNELKSTYKKLADAFLASSSSKLLIMTSPPLRPVRTNPHNANRARLLATWLTQQEFGRRVEVFDFFDLLAEPADHTNGNMLKKIYRRPLPWDNHPNKRASQHIAPILATKIVDFLRQ